MLPVQVKHWCPFCGKWKLTWPFLKQLFHQEAAVSHHSLHKLIFEAPVDLKEQGSLAPGLWAEGIEKQETAGGKDG